MGDLSDGVKRKSCHHPQPQPQLLLPADGCSFDEECLLEAEKAAEIVVECVHPTRDSEERRTDVIDFVHRLVKTNLNFEVFAYGSVPLKTYLPDGDIDLTVLKIPNPERESVAHDVFGVLQREEKNAHAEYQVRDTQFIDAEVKLVKCLVQNFVVDISFNQLGGFSTLCFLEQVDRVIGRNHLFKRSIMLVKTWCYHESRILGAHHGLISTYALEVLVLYIFHLFHSTLTGPLMVLYQFLAHYSQFDWENHCISLKGPVLKSSLPDIVVNVPERGFYNLMFTQEFLENCTDIFSVPQRGVDEKPKSFQAKHLNIIDPLRENNNLGRSVNRGNFYRIQSAFKYGARKLGQVLSGSRDKVADGITDFFANTLSRHNKQHTDIINQHLPQIFGDEDSFTTSEPFSDDELLLKSSFSDSDKDSGGMKEKSSLLFNEDLDINSVEASDEAYDTLSSESSALLSVNHYYLKGQYLSSRSSVENGSLVKDMYDNTHEWCLENSHASPVTGSDSPSCKASVSETISHDSGEIDVTGPGESEAFNPLADLAGEYESHIRSLLYGQSCHGYCTLSEFLPSKVENKNSWNIVRQSMPFMGNHFSVSMGHNANSSAKAAFHVTAYRTEAKRKPRGTGTYIPRVNVFDREKSQRSRNRPPGHSNGNWHTNGFFPVNGKKKYAERDGHGVVAPRVDVACRSPHSVGNGHQPNNFNSVSSTVEFEFGTVGNLAQVVISGLLNDRDSTTKQESGAVEPVCLKNDQEFPPLNLQQ